MSLRRLYYTLPPGLRYLARKVYFLPVDTYEGLTGKRHKYEPPKGDIFVGHGDFIDIGNHHLDLLKEFAALKPFDSVLDIGSGIGRTAVALTAYMHRTGRYEGFDVVRKGIDWCNRKIKPDHPNFNFQHILLNNDLYTSDGMPASKFTFPYDDASFDVVFAFSVFTHLQLPEIANYIRETCRVLKPGGRSLATFFIYNEDNEDRISARKDFGFPVAGEGFRLMDARVTAANIAIAEDTLASMLDGLPMVLGQMIPGYWKEDVSKSGKNSFQDVVILHRTSG